MYFHVCGRHTQATHRPFFSYLEKCNYDGSQHDKNRVEYRPEDERDRQTPHFCELINIWERSLVKETPVGLYTNSQQFGSM